MLRCVLERRVLKRNRARTVLRSMHRLEHLDTVSNAMLKRQVRRCSSAVLRRLLKR